MAALTPYPAYSDALSPASTKYSMRSKHGAENKTTFAISLL
jgi:hypothetical protein